MATTEERRASALHPLEPLRGEEISAASAVLRRERGLGDEAMFVSIQLAEPDKATVRTHGDGQAPADRSASIVLRDRSRRVTVQAVVSITRELVVSWHEIAGAQPSVTFDEFDACEETVRADARWQEAMRRRGITDFDLAMIDPWSAGYYGPEDDPSRRLVRALTFMRTSTDDNGYARPVEGLLTLVDLDDMQVVDVEDHGVVPLPPKAGNYWPEAILDADNSPRFDSVSGDLRAVEITQPEGPSFTVDGHEVTWHKWQFRLGFTAREGPVLHTVTFADRGVRREVLYRASLSEMLVPYGDPSPTHWRKNAFDEGEYGIGMLANSLELGCDCLGEIHYFDGVLADTAGEPMTLRNAVCMHEEDFNVAWKHTDLRTGRVEVRRRRRLVISSFATVANYEYGLFWYLFEDGSIEAEMKMTGIISTGALADGAEPDFGTVVAPGLYGPNHQHFFCFRLDMAVDGETNSVYEVNTEGVPTGPENPHGNAWRTREQLLGSEAQAQRSLDQDTARYWKVVNPFSRNRLGQPVSYRLLPGTNVGHFAQPDAKILDRAGFLNHQLWVTPFDPAQRYAAGDYPNQNPGGDGLPRYTAGDRSVRDTDVVLWYTVGAHHVVRPEDWPVMPVTGAGFQLQPFGFFDGNPSLDLPRPSSNGHCG